MLILSPALLALSLIVGMGLDLALGEAKRWHPLVGFGRLANWLEHHLNHAAATRWTGLAAWLPAVVPLTALVWLMLVRAEEQSFWLALPGQALFLYLCLGLRSLRDHNLPIQRALEDGELPLARELTARIVSRDTADGDTAYLAKASVESVLENGCDAVFGTLFWFVLLGGAGAICYRLVNTLDAMWGYRSSRFLRFGCVAARVDDVMNWIPARLTALTYAVLGHTVLAWRCWRTQAPAWPSPNAGPVMAAGAGALGVTVGGLARYDGADEQRPLLGAGPAAGAADIQRALLLVSGGSFFWAGGVALAAFLCGGW